MGANDRQVGGDHYRKAAARAGEQHWDRQWRLYGRGYFIGQITRYAERYHLKNGIQDLKKIIHYAEKLTELEEAWADGTGPAPGDLASNGPLPGVEYTHTSDPFTKDDDPPEMHQLDGLLAEVNATPPLGNGFAEAIRQRAAATPPISDVDHLILEAIARGWTHPTTGNRVMDPELAFAIGREIQQVVNDGSSLDAKQWSEPDGPGGHRWPTKTSNWKGYHCLKCGKVVDEVQPSEPCPGVPPAPLDDGQTRPNSETMTEAAVKWGLTHWRCISDNTNEEWLRIDGARFSFKTQPTGTNIPHALKEYDTANPLLWPDPAPTPATLPFGTTVYPPGPPAGP